LIIIIKSSNHGGKAACQFYKEFGKQNRRQKCKPSMLILKVLNKKVHSNPKYAGVKGTISTGKTVKDVATVSK
jgi:hypothetical protein